MSENDKNVPLRRLRSDLLRGAIGSADLKISKSALLSLNHHNFPNTKPMYTEYSFMESLLNYLALEIKTKMVDLLPWRQQTLIRRPKPL